MSPRDIPRRADRPVGITVIGQDTGSHGDSFKHGGQERPCGASQSFFLKIFFLSVPVLGLRPSDTEIFILYSFRLSLKRKRLLRWGMVKIKCG